MRLKNVFQKDMKQQFTEKGYQVPTYDREKIVRATVEEPTWLHFGTGNIFRAFPSAILDSLLNQGLYDKGVVAVEGFDYEIIEKAYKPFDNLSLLVVLNADGGLDKRVIGSVVKSLTANEKDEDFSYLVEAFRKPSVQMVSFTITEKGYSLMGPDGSLSGVVKADFDQILSGKEIIIPKHLMGKIAWLLWQRYQAGAVPVAMVSMDNCSHNGDKLKEAVVSYVRKWVEAGVCGQDFLDYVNNPEKVSFPLSMIDKITPRPDKKVVAMLEQDGFEDAELIITDKNTYTAAFVNAEATQYLVIEDLFPNGRPPLEKGGIYFTDRETVDRVEKMKVCTCLNPLHTALAIFGCLLGYHTIWEEMKDDDLCAFVTKMGYGEGMPVVVNPQIIDPEQFIGEVLQKRLVNPFMPDTPQRIATDTSQKLSIRFGETLKAYGRQGVEGLQYIPVVLAGYLRYLIGYNDDMEAFELSPDPLLGELTEFMKKYAGAGKTATAEELRPILGRTDIFGVDLYEYGLAEKITAYFNEMNQGKGCVRKVLNSLRNQ
ncbi:MAG: mannitol dehydrogenase family protein [Lachnospiraceae bacterium]